MDRQVSYQDSATEDDQLLSELHDWADDWPTLDFAITMFEFLAINTGYLNCLSGVSFPDISVGDRGFVEKEYASDCSRAQG